MNQKFYKMFLTNTNKNKKEEIKLERAGEYLHPKLLAVLFLMNIYKQSFPTVFSLPTTIGFHSFSSILFGKKTFHYSPCPDEVGKVLNDALGKAHLRF